MKIRDMFKKLDPKNSDSPSHSNPYAQEQQPTDPPPGYQEHDPRDRDQYIQQPPQKSYGGLPSGPRSGVRPGGAAPGYPARSASNGPPPQQYPSPGARPSQYGGSDYSPNSAGSTPVFPSNTSSPALGSAYPKEKYGAQDGVGGTRWEAPGASSYGNAAPLSSQRQGGYGSLDAQSGGLYDNYNAATRNNDWTTAPSHASSADGGRRSEGPGMSGEKDEDTEVADIKDEVKQVQKDTLGITLRSVAIAEEAENRLDEADRRLAEQEEMMDNAESRLEDGRFESNNSKGQNTLLAHENRPLLHFGFGNYKRDKVAAEQAENETKRQQRLGELRAEQQRQREELERPLQGSTMRTAEPKTLGKSDRSKYTFEDDDGTQEETLEKTDEALAKLETVVGRIQTKAGVLGKRADASLARLPRMTEDATRLEDDVRKNHAAMKRAAGYR